MFESALLKIERAQKHIGDLDCAFNGFRDTNTHTFHTSRDPGTNTLSVDVHFSKAIPSEISLILGDAIHNLRTALDHAMWELMGIDGGTQDRETAFPFRRYQVEYEAACNRIKTFRDDTKKFLIALAAYESGRGENLYALNCLDNAEKHTRLTPIIGLNRIKVIKVTGPDGKLILGMENCGFCMGPDGRARLIGNFQSDCTIDFGDNPKPTLDMFFGNVKFFETLPLIETLTDLSYDVSDVIGQFEVLVEGRNWC